MTLGSQFFNKMPVWSAVYTHSIITECTLGSYSFSELEVLGSLDRVPARVENKMSYSWELLGSMWLHLEG